MFRHLLLYSAFLASALTVVVSSCENANIPGDDEEVTNVTGKKYKVNIVTRATGSDIIYPVNVTATDSKGNTVARQTIASADQQLSLQLPEGSYSIVATSGTADFSRGYSTTPFLVGHSDITVKSAAVNVNIIMSYAVASVDITLRSVPQSVTAATAALSPLYATVDSYGTASGTATVTVPCSRQSDGSWATGTVYVLPGTGTNTVLTLSLTTPSGTETYGVTYSQSLRAAVPYRFTGEFSGDVTPSDVRVTGTLSCGTWEDEVSDTFSFGPTGTNAFGTVVTGETQRVATMPEAGTLWDGHIVATISDGNALLLSTQEWANMTSLYYEADPTAAATVAAKYVEGTLTGWDIPTREQATLIRDRWGGNNLYALNATLVAAGLTPLSLTDEKGDNARYLCAAASYTFSFAAKSQFVAAGKTVKTYRLRLVKPVHFVVR